LNIHTFVFYLCPVRNIYKERFMQLFKQFRFAALIAAFLVISGNAFAADGSATNATTVSSNLTLSATVETAITLTISTNGGVTITGSAGAFAVDFGNVNGLGVGTPTTGVTRTPSTGGVIYTTPISVTPTFSGFSSTTATVKVYQDASTSQKSQDAAREGASSVSAVPTTPETATSITTSAASATGISRVVGIFVSNANSTGNVTGSLAPKFIYVVTVP
jgi:hypothetical protein